MLTPCQTTTRSAPKRLRTTQDQVTILLNRLTTVSIEIEVHLKNINDEYKAVKCSLLESFS
jgi:hypothetical protein